MSDAPVNAVILAFIWRTVGSLGRMVTREMTMPESCQHDQGTNSQGECVACGCLVPMWSGKAMPDVSQTERSACGQCGRDVVLRVAALADLEAKDMRQSHWLGRALTAEGKL